MKNNMTEKEWMDWTGSPHYVIGVYLQIVGKLFPNKTTLTKEDMKAFVKEWEDGDYWGSNGWRLQIELTDTANYTAHMAIVYGDTYAVVLGGCNDVICAYHYNNEEPEKNDGWMGEDPFLTIDLEDLVKGNRYD